MRPASLHACHVGSRARSGVRLALLLVCFAVALILLYFWLAKLTDSPLFVFPLIVVLTAIRRAMDSHARRGWLDLFMKDAAYGLVIEYGIEYRTPFSSQFVSWSEMERLEFSQRSGRIKMYVSDKALPVQFAPSKQLGAHSGVQSLPDVLRQQVEFSGGSFVLV